MQCTLQLTKEACLSKLCKDVLPAPFGPAITVTIGLFIICYANTVGKSSFIKSI